MVNGISRREREKLMRKDEIVKAAENVFIRLGYEKASMDEVAREAQFTRKTIYRYFANKEDLYLAVVAKGFLKLLSDMSRAKQDGNTGFEKLRNMGLAYYHFYRRNPDQFQLMNLIGHVRSEGKNTAKNEEFDKADSLIAKEITDIIVEGKADGSIRSDLDTVMGTYSAQFLLTGFFSQLSMTGKTFTKHLSIDQKTFIDYILNLIFNIFRTQE